MSFKNFHNLYKDYPIDKFPIDNLLEIPKPMLYECSVIKYFIAHSHLIIQANYVNGEHESLFMLDFAGVHYFELVPSWKGINVRVEAPELCIPLLKRNPYYREIEFDKYPELPLYTIEAENSKFRVIAGVLSVTQLYSQDEYQQYLTSI